MIPPEEFNALPEDRRREIQAAIETLEKDLEHVIRQLPQWQKQRRDEVRQLNRETTRYAVGHLINEVKRHSAIFQGSFNTLRRFALTSSTMSRRLS